MYYKVINVFLNNIHIHNNETLIILCILNTSISKSIHTD